jgi:putative membrane protein
MFRTHATLVGLLLMLAAVHAQQPAPASRESGRPTQGTSNLAGGDRDFITKASADGHKEIELARIAEQKATSPAVKTLASRIHKDHTQADQELKSLAQSKGVTLPAPPDHKAETARLEKDANIDRTYSNMMVADHKRAIALFERASMSKDADVKAFAEKTLPALREHLKLSQEAAASTRSTSSATPSTASPTGTSGTTNPGTAAPTTPRSPGR